MREPEPYHPFWDTMLLLFESLALSVVLLALVWLTWRWVHGYYWRIFLAVCIIWGPGTPLEMAIIAHYRRRRAGQTDDAPSAQ